MWPAALPWVLLAAALLAWEAAGRLGWLSVLLFPPPGRILARAWALTLTGELPRNLALTLSRLGLGVLCGASAGLALGLLMGWLPPLRRVLDPLVAAVHPLPKIAIYPLILVFFGLGEQSKVLVVALAAFFPLLVNTAAGVRQIPPLYFEVARNYGAPRWLTLWRVLLPGSLPFAMAGLLLAFNLSLMMTIAIEMVSGSDGLGWLLWRGWQVMRTEDVYVSLALVVGLGAVANRLLHALTRRLVPWQAEPAGGPG